MSRAADGTFLVGKPPVPCCCEWCKAERDRQALEIRYQQIMEEWKVGQLGNV